MSDIRPPARFGIGAGAAARPAWNHRAERGSARLTRLMIWLVLHLGWRTGRALLYPIALYYLLAAKGPRGASARFLRRALGRPVRLRDLYRHVFAFAAMLLDRVFFLTGRTEDFTLSVHGLAHLEAAIAAGRGAVLLGGHLGSFEALRAFGRQSPVPVRMLMYRANRGAFTAAIERLDPGFARSVIEIGTPESMLRVSEAIGRGELVGILADRAPEPGAGGAPAAAASRRVRTRFL
ncbi:MAG: hypothetical protein KGL52_12855, partial [Rhodospirillales bacterium]|nr:hypothetical protein [Rhodospirillales bacterium]